MAVTLLPFVFPGVAGVACWFQMRAPHTGAGPQAPREGNISFEIGDDPTAVAASRRDLIAQAFPQHGRAVEICELRQVHGCDLRMEPEPTPFFNPAPLAEGDGMATARPGRVLLVKTADCQAVLLAHERARFVAALHVGWRGNRADFPGRAVQTLCERCQARPEEWFAVRGPSLGPAAAEFVNYDTEWGQDFAPWHDAQRRTVDLWRLTRAQLIRAGLREERIFGLDLCTSSLPEHFFSYRRDPKCGRQAALITILP